jgi:methanogenic corrinoid protein MtbC1
MNEVPDVARDVLVGLLIAGDGARADALVDSIVDQGVPLVTVISDLLGPALATVGLQWQYGSITVAVEHRATSICDGILARLLASTEPAAAAGRVWLTGAEGEWHTMPPRLVAAVWQCLGWDVVALTPSLPASELRLLASVDRASLAGVSCSLTANLVPAWQTISALRQSGFRIVAGGRAFGGEPGLAEVLGADAYCPDPILASEQLALWDPRTRRSPRPATLMPAWQRLREVWDGLPMVVENALLLARELGEASLSAEVLRQDLSLLARTVVAAALCARPAVLTGQLSWQADLVSGRSEGADPRFLLSVLERVLPANELVRSVLDAV